MKFLLAFLLAAFGSSHPLANVSKSVETSVWIAKDSYCNCGLKADGSIDNWDPAGIWLDIVFIIDTSATMSASLDQAKSMLTSAISRLSTNLSAEFYSRIGVIAASDTIQVVYNLNMSSADNLDSVKPSNANKADFDKAFSAALEMFEQASHPRDNVQEIIYYLGKTEANPKNKDVVYFKNTDGIIIVNDFITNGDTIDPLLQQVASDNFFFPDLKDGAKTLAVLCEANCFCDQSITFIFNDDEKSPRTKGNRGCYKPLFDAATQPEARAYCQTMGPWDIDGALVSIHDQDKEFFVNSLASLHGPRAKYWLGLQNNGGWKWDDQSTDPFADWDVAQPDTNGGQFQCAYATQTTGLNVKWTAADCSMPGVIYVCETAPCSVGYQKC